MRNLKLLEYNAAQSIPGVAKCIIAENAQGNFGAVCGRKLRKLDDGEWKEVMDLFDFDDDEVISFEAIFGKFCAISKMGQIITFQLEVGSIDNVGDIFSGVKSAKWSPDLELLVVITCNGQLILMRENFDIVSEKLLETTEFGEKSAVTLGWGKKETQFHGSEGKKAAKTMEVQREQVADFDDQCANIVWRNDGQHFATNTVHENMRTIRIWSREGVLEYTAENIPRLHGGLAWWWGDENLIVSVDTSAQDQRRIIFYETNGLRHGEFTLPQNYVVKQIAQGTLRAARILTVLCEDNGCDVVLVYTMNNYHWYPKQTLKLPERFRSMFWDSQERLTILAGEKLHYYKWIYSVDSNEHGLVGSIDGDRILVTDFSKCIFPPPIAGYTYTATEAVNQIVFLEDSILAQTADGSFVLFRGNDPNDSPKRFELPDRCRNSLIHLTGVKATEVFAVLCSLGSYRLVLIDAISGEVSESAALSKQPQCLCMSADKDHLLVKFEDEYVHYSCDLEAIRSGVCSREKFERLVSARPDYLIGFNASETKLYLNEQELCSNASSFVLHGDSFILLTTLDQTLRSYPLFGGQHDCCDSRQLEIGSLLVTSVAVDGRVVLQMPRGNLETIYPRPMLLRDINSYLRKDKFSEAFRLMKIHRINLNLLYDDDPDLFPERVSKIVQQIRSSADLNLFIMDLKEEDVTKTMYKSYYSLVERGKSRRVKDVAEICNLILQACLEQDSQDRHLSVVACYAKKTSIEDLESALQWIGREQSRFHESLEYLLLFVDVKKMMDVALGLYDFKLFVRVAQFSQVDPKEYLSLVNEMRSYANEDFRKYKINLHLKRYHRALNNVAACPEHFSECLNLIIEQRLYTKSRALFPRGSAEARAVAEAYAVYLFSKKYYKEAAMLFLQAREYVRASQCFERASCTELCLEAVRLAGQPLEPVVKRLIASLTAENKHAEAGALMKQFSYPPEDFCTVFIEGACWEHAYCSLHSLPQEQQSYFRGLMEETMLSHNKNLEEKVTELHEKLAGLVARLVELREQKSSRQDDCMNFYDDADFPMSEAGSMISRTSRTDSSTARSSSAKSGSITTFKTNKQMRKAKKPRYALKKGSPYEDLAIVQECSSLIEQLKPLSEEIVPLLEAFELLGNVDGALNLQRNFSSLLHQTRKSFILSVWPEILEGDPQVISDPELRNRPTFLENLTSRLLFATP